MTALQLAFAAAFALIGASFLECVGNWILARMVSGHVPGRRVLRAARFAFFFVFLFYSVSRTMSGALDALVDPIVVTLGLFAAYAVVAVLISQRARHR